MRVWTARQAAAAANAADSIESSHATGTTSQRRRSFYGRQRPVQQPADEVASSVNRKKQVATLPDTTTTVTVQPPPKQEALEDTSLTSFEAPVELALQHFSASSSSTAEAPALAEEAAEEAPQAVIPRQWRPPAARQETPTSNPIAHRRRSFYIEPRLPAETRQRRAWRSTRTASVKAVARDCHPPADRHPPAESLHLEEENGSSFSIEIEARPTAQEASSCSKKLHIDLQGIQSEREAQKEAAVGAKLDAAEQDKAAQVVAIEPNEAQVYIKQVEAEMVEMMPVASAQDELDKQSSDTPVPKPEPQAMVQPTQLQVVAVAEVQMDEDTDWLWSPRSRPNLQDNTVWANNVADDQIVEKLPQEEADETKKSSLDWHQNTDGKKEEEVMLKAPITDWLRLSTTGKCRWVDVLDSEEDSEST